MARFTMIIPLPISGDDPGLPAQGLVRGVVNEVTIAGLVPLRGEVIVFASGGDAADAGADPSARLAVGRADETGTVRMEVTLPACVGLCIVAVLDPDGAAPRVSVAPAVSCRAA